MRQTFRTADSSRLLCGRPPTGNGDAEIYRIKPEEVPELERFKDGGRINDRFSDAALSAVAHFLTQKIAVEVDRLNQAVGKHLSSETIGR